MSGSRLDTRFGALTLRKRNKSPRPYRIEHRAVAPELIEECPEWGKWHNLAGYTSKGERKKALDDILREASGRWEYRLVDDTTQRQENVAHSTQGVI